MNLPAILTSILLIAACVIPFVIIKRRSKKAEKEFLQILFDHASTGNNEISQYEFTSRLAIGFAEATNFVFFLKKRGGKEVMTQIDLKRIESCYINKTTRNSTDGNYSSTDKIELRFAASDKGNPEAVFEFYNIEHDSLSMSEELQLAEKWHSIVNNRLSGKKSK